MNFMALHDPNRIFVCLIEELFLMISSSFEHNNEMRVQTIDINERYLHTYINVSCFVMI